MRIGLLLAVAALACSCSGHGHRAVQNGALAFWSDRGGLSAAYVTNASGTLTRHLSGMSSGEENCSAELTWTPDGRRLAFVGPTYGIRVYNTQTGRYATLDPEGSTCDTFSPSPDTPQHLAVTSVNDLSVRDPYTEVGTVYAGSPDSSAEMPAWSPDGKLVAYVRTAQSDNVTSYLEAAAPDGTHVTSLARDVSYLQPLWSPDGRKLVFLAHPQTGVNGIVEVVDRSGSHERKLSAGRDENQVYAWSPDSKHIVFSGAQHGTFVVDADGKNLHRISRVGATSISWSPDGKLIAYTAGKPSDAYLMNADGTGAHLLPVDLPYGGDVALISWNPAGVPVRAIAGTPVRISRSQLGVQTGPLVAFSARTGKRIAAFPEAAGGQVDAIVSDAHGGWFVGGTFTKLGGRRCANLGHVLASGRVDPRFCSKVDGEVETLAVLGSTLYLGGSFEELAGARRISLGALDTRSVRATGWDPFKGAPWPLRMDEGPLRIAAFGNSIYLLGPFGRIGNSPREQLGAADPVTAVAQPWRPNAPMTPVGLHVETTFDHIAPSSSVVYVAGPYGDPAAFDAKAGAPVAWAAKGTWAVAVEGRRLYAGGGFKSFEGAPRTNLAAVDAATRTLLPWAPVETQGASLIAPTPTSVWVSQDLHATTRVDGFDAATARRLAPRVALHGGPVFALAASPTVVVVGGAFDAASF